MNNLFDLFYQSSGVCTDTRKIEKDCLFICLSGDNFNGNTFAQKAIELGAKFVIVDDVNFKVANNIFLVDESLLFLQELAKFHRNAFDIPVIGITGSNGKTSSKELINCVLQKKYHVLSTEGNLNNHIGVPLTLLNLNKKHEVAIIEMGANKFGDIKELCDIASPTHGIITNIGKAHLEGFINFEGVLKTKKELYDSVVKANGTLFFNSDDEVLANNVPKNIETISFGTKNSDIIGKLISLDPFIRMSFSANFFNSEELSTQMIGKYNFYNFMAAISIGIYFAVEPNLICDAITSYVPTNNRSQVLEKGKVKFIMDAYNANPSSMKSAIESFSMIKNSKKTMILGDMFELGNQSSLEHKIILDLIVMLNINSVLIGKHFYEYASKFSNLNFFPSKVEFESSFKIEEYENQLVLVKGSRGVGLEKLLDLF
jgi:UDP-N-acetylmuramoyl-tripeptide--D-alanyl-D-alanine ligase